MHSLLGRSNQRARRRLPSRAPESRWKTLTGEPLESIGRLAECGAPDVFPRSGLMSMFRAIKSTSGFEGPRTRHLKSRLRAVVVRLSTIEMPLIVKWFVEQTLQ